MADPVSVTLQLNRPALDRLLGGDTQLEVELRHQIVQDFCRHHLKELVATPEFNAFVAKYRHEVQGMIETLVGKWGWNSRLGKLEPHVVADLDNLIRNRIQVLVQEASSLTIDKVAPELIAKLEQQVVDYITRYESKTMAAVQKKIDALYADLDRRFEERMDKAFEERVQGETRRRLLAAANPFHDQIRETGT